MINTPLAIDLFCGLGGWADGFLANGYKVIGFDIERRPYPGQLVLQDVRSLHGSQFRNATVIVASPPCQQYSYRAMPFKRAKALPPPDNALFEACFRIQREASEAAGRYIPMVVENVKGAQPWVGSARCHYGSFYLWGDVPALMPFAAGSKVTNHIATNSPKGSGATSWFFGNTKHELRAGVKGFARGFEDTPMAQFSSRSAARKLASAEIAKIPLPLSQHIARCFKPEGAHDE